MNASQNICSGFTKLSTDFSTSNFVDNVYNFVYNSIFSLFRHFLMWITFIRPPVFFVFFWKLQFLLSILYIVRNHVLFHTRKYYYNIFTYP